MPSAARPRLALVPNGQRAAVPDEMVVERILGGDLGGREELYRRYVDYVAGISVRLLRSVDLAEDVVQDAFITAFEQLTALRDRSAFKSWLASITVSLVRRRLRKQKLLRFIGLDGTSHDAALDCLASADASPEDRAELAALDVSLHELPVERRIAWMLRRVEGESLEDVATACSCSLATAKRWIAAADAHVGRHFGEESTHG